MTRSVAAVAARPGFPARRAQIGRGAAKNSDPRSQWRRRSDPGTFRNAVSAPQSARIEEAGDPPLARVTHDFNNLLGIITLNLELARARAGDCELRRMIDEALSAAWQGSELTRRLAGPGRRLAT
jgi:hypothetical protein